MGWFRCEYCKVWFKSQKGLTLHMNASRKCAEAERQEMLGIAAVEGTRATRSRSNAAAHQEEEEEDEQEEEEEDAQEEEAEEEQEEEEDQMNWDGGSSGGGGGGSEEEGNDTEQAADPRIGNQNDANWEAGEEANGEGSAASDEEPEEEDSEDEDDTDDEPSDVEAEVLHQNDNQRVPKTPPDDRNIKAFRKYCAMAQRSFIPMNRMEKRGVRLMDTLRKNKAPLTAYDDLLGWHLEETGARVAGEPLGEVPSYLSRTKLMSFLKERYNLTDKFPFQKKTTLPHAGDKIQVVCRDARDCLEQLLTDPRLTDDDFCFFDDDPLAPPPQTMTKIGQLNTGEAYRNGYNQYVQNPKEQIGISIQFYIDGAVTGQFQNLSITALKMTLSCFTLEYRKKDHAWVEIGFVANFSAGKTKGKKMFGDTQHDQALEDLIVFERFVPNQEDTTTKVNKAQDFHCQLETILKSYIPLEANGMLWDLHYRGKLYRNVELVFWTAMVRADTDEAEKHCGKYRSRSGNVKHLCRYCHCPNKETDDPLADYPAKTVSEIKEMVRNGNKRGLQKISQQYIDNVWYKLRFDPTYDTGIHGACPSEMLHAILLGIFLYVKDGFFSQIGYSSQLAKDIDALTQQYGEFFHHNSERDLPNCKFSHGLMQKKKLMAMEYRGVLLLIATALRSTRGYEMLKENVHFATQALRKDWIRLVELLLEWEAFLNEREMDVSIVERLEKKNRFIMYLIKKVLRRSDKMGLRVMKFHAITHMADDIILYGVPQEHDTGANESGHKITKVAAKLTQKKRETFEIQTANRLMEFMLVEWAMCELDGRRLFDYYGDFDPVPEADDGSFVIEVDDVSSGSGRSSSSSSSSDDDDEEEEVQCSTGGTRLEVYWEWESPVCADRMPMIGWKGRTQKMWRAPEMATVMVGEHIVEFLLGLQDLMEETLGIRDYSLSICTEHKRNDLVFRGHPDYRGDGPWRDWAMINWGDPDEYGYGDLPCQIWCFVIIDGLPEPDSEDADSEGAGIEYGGIFLENGTYAVVEFAKWDPNPDEVSMSDLFIPMNKVVGRDGKRRFYLADVDSIVSPMCVVPDIGCKGGRRYFQVCPRSEWVKLFIGWVEDPHEFDKMT